MYQYSSTRSSELLQNYKDYEGKFESFSNSDFEILSQGRYMAGKSLARKLYEKSSGSVKATPVPDVVEKTADEPSEPNLSKKRKFCVDQIKIPSKRQLPNTVTAQDLLFLRSSPRTATDLANLEKARAKQRTSTLQVLRPYPCLNSPVASPDPCWAPPAPYFTTGFSPQAPQESLFQPNQLQQMNQAGMVSAASTAMTQLSKIQMPNQRIQYPQNSLLDPMNTLMVNNPILMHYGPMSAGHMTHSAMSPVITMSSCMHSPGMTQVFSGLSPVAQVPSSAVLMPSTLEPVVVTEHEKVVPTPCDVNPNNIGENRDVNLDQDDHRDNGNQDLSVKQVDVTSDSQDKQKGEPPDPYDHQDTEPSDHQDTEPPDPSDHQDTKPPDPYDHQDTEPPDPYDHQDTENPTPTSQNMTQVVDEREQHQGKHTTSVIAEHVTDGSAEGINSLQALSESADVIRNHSTSPSSR